MFVVRGVKRGSEGKLKLFQNFFELFENYSRKEAAKTTFRNYFFEVKLIYIP